MSYEITVKGRDGLAKTELGFKGDLTVSVGEGGAVVTSIEVSVSAASRDAASKKALFEAHQKFLDICDTLKVLYEQHQPL